MKYFFWIPLLVLNSRHLEPASRVGQPPANFQTITAINRLAAPRLAETVSLPTAQLARLFHSSGKHGWVVRDSKTGAVLVSQLVEADSGKQDEMLLFQSDFKARETKKFTVAVSPRVAEPQPKSQYVAFSRFVPERIDDYAWENDLVAFRTYGPVAQQLTEAGRKDGTLTSGMDCWLKRVRYPVINKWYAGFVAKPGFYHTDHGEGYDPYHVGDSRGCGGLGVWNDQDSTLAVSKNFVTYKRLANGPLRTVFELTYAPWLAGGQLLRERLRVTLDVGRQLSRYDVFVTTDHGPVPPLTVGITLHEKKGTVAGNPVLGWFRHWEPIDDSELGTALVVAPDQVQNWWTFRTARPDQSHVFVRLKPTGHATYYAGYGWTKAGRFTNVGDWEDYLTAEAQRLNSPLAVMYNR